MPQITVKRTRAIAQEAELSKVEEDGLRLARALEQLGLSQSEAGRKSEIGQKRINEFCRGNRALGREDLRRLAHVGVSPEFILGVTKTHVSPGVSRERRTLADDLAQTLAVEVSSKLSPNAEKLEAEVERHWVVDGASALSRLIDVVVADAQSILFAVRATRDVAALLETVEEIRDGLSADEHSRLFRSERLVKMSEALQDKIQSARIGEAISLAYAGPFPEPLVPKRPHLANSKSPTKKRTPAK